MEQLLTADELFAIGVEIEKNGRTFYTVAAAMAAGAPIKKLLVELAAWEAKHIEVFTALRKKLPPQSKNDNLFDPAGEIGMYLKATADSHVFIKNRNLEALAAACGTPAAILEMALSFEKDSVVFYSSVREAVADGAGGAEVVQLIREELMHIGFITRELQKIKAGR